MTTKWGAPICGAVMKELRASGMPGKTLVKWRGRIVRAAHWSFNYDDYRLPADHNYYRALAQGPDWWPWFATDDIHEGPADFDGKVLLRNGVAQGGVGWRWRERGPTTIIAYKRKPKASEPVAPETADEKPEAPALRCKVPEGQTPLNDDLGHRYLDVFNEGMKAREDEASSPYHGHSLEHCLHSAGWVQRDLRLALDAAKGEKPEAPALPVTVELWERVKANLRSFESLCSWLLHRFGNDSPEGNEAAFRLVEARAILAALNPPEVDPLERTVADLLCESDPEGADDEWSYIPQAKALLAAASRYGYSVSYEPRSLRTNYRRSARTGASMTHRLAQVHEKGCRTAPPQCFNGGYVGHGRIEPMDGRPGGLLAYGLSLLRSLRGAVSLTRGSV